MVSELKMSFSFIIYIVIWLLFVQVDHLNIFLHLDNIKRTCETCQMRWMNVSYESAEAGDGHSGDYQIIELNFGIAE